MKKITKKITFEINDDFFYYDVEEKKELIENLKDFLQDFVFFGFDNIEKEYINGKGEYIGTIDGHIIKYEEIEEVWV